MIRVVVNVHHLVAVSFFVPTSKLEHLLAKVGPHAKPVEET